MNAFRYPVEIRSLTSLRFFASLWVVVHHYQLLLPTAQRIESGIVGKGSLAVDFFFMLSGFVLTHVYSSRPKFDLPRYGDFLIRRLARIYPLHLVTLGFYVGLFFVARTRIHDLGKYDFSALIPNLLLVHAWGNEVRGSFNYPSWSISAEWFAYLLFPALLLLAGRITSRGSVFIGLIFAGLLLLLFWNQAPLLFGKPMTSLANNFGIYRIFPEFFLGIGIYFYGAGKQTSWAGSLVCMGATAAAVISLCLINASNIFIILGLAFLIFSVAEMSKRRENRFLANSAMVYLGEISYSIYMVHAPIGSVAGVIFHPTSLLQSILLVGGAIAVAVGVSAISYRFVELPSRRGIVMACDSILPLTSGKSS